MLYSIYEIESVCEAAGNELSNSVTCWKARLIKGYQSSNGTIIVTEEPPKEALVVQRAAIYVRVSSHEHRENLERQAEWMISYCAARGYQVQRAR